MKSQLDMYMELYPNWVDTSNKWPPLHLIMQRFKAVVAVNRQDEGRRYWFFKSADDLQDFKDWMARQ